eukprot:CAMPEP_0185258132 /NCGR_PEP_ID=MMETSP1359-20130426/7107_1 /TAXON_ID=552665 /ORGANISM="Bigelowiella longifila, Strain CCMP242" /LENGTH=56 /DNA_ID=CAMNT_0027843503 /DNA_START=103 /DNA_END=269 /DNA_ORIENTATION=-
MFIFIGGMDRRIAPATGDSVDKQKDVWICSKGSRMKNLLRLNVNNVCTSHFANILS